MKIERLSADTVYLAAPLVADFRVTLDAFKGVFSTPDVSAGTEELNEYLQLDYPAFLAMDGGKCVGYIVCRVDVPCVWVESVFVAEQYRRNGIATLLFLEAETLADSYGESTTFNYVHPNNDTMIAFLKKNGYTVLNLIEIRKPYRGEKVSSQICVGNHQFDY